MSPESWEFTTGDWLLRLDSRTGNPPVNRRKTPDLPPVARDCAESPDRESEPIKSDAIDRQDHSSDASVCRSKPRLGVSKGQEKGNLKSG